MVSITANMGMGDFMVNPSIKLPRQHRDEPHFPARMKYMPLPA